MSIGAGLPWKSQPKQLTRPTCLCLELSSVIRHRWLMTNMDMKYFRHIFMVHKGLPIHTYMHTYIHTYIHTCTCTPSCIHTYMHTCIHAYIHTYIRTTYIIHYTYIHALTFIHINANIPTCMHAYIHAAFLQIDT